MSERKNVAVKQWATSVAKFNTHTRMHYMYDRCAQNFFRVYSFLMNCFRFSPFIASSYTFLRIKSAFQLHDTFAERERDACACILSNFLWYHMMIYLFVPCAFPYVSVYVCERESERAFSINCTLFTLLQKYFHTFISIGLAGSFFSIVAVVVC